MGRDRGAAVRRPRPAHDRQRPDRRLERDARPRARGWRSSPGILDLLKGVAAVLLARVLGAGPGVEVLAAMAAVIGHSRSPFLGFGGGRGVAVGFGALFAFAPLVALMIIPVFAITILVTRYSSMGSLVASALGGVLLAVATYVVPLSPWYYVYAVGGAVLIWVFHVDNIQRLLAGQERRIGTPRDPS